MGTKYKQKSFARVKSNKKAIAERGWFPYNLNLMLDPSICASIKKEEKANELLEKIAIIISRKDRLRFTNLVDLAPTFDATFVSQPISDEKKRETIALKLLHGALIVLYSNMISTQQESE